MLQHLDRPSAVPAGLGQADLDYLKRSDAENPVFWERFSGRPDVRGRKVLDVGCGHGGLCFDVARAGAAIVVGIDIEPDRIAFAKEYARSREPNLRNLSFHAIALGALRETDFDLVLSKDSFEHIDDIPGVLADMRERLKPGGRAYIGFSPLYNSYNGAHGRCGVKFPWGHLILGEQRIVDRLNRQGEQRIASVRDLGLNMHSLAEHTAFLQNSGMRIVDMRVNVGNHPLMGVFSTIGRVPFLREYFSHNLYCVLERP